ncbi:MAG: hypothetical protein LBC53_09905 [Spirochaetaceae bacterium]|nr:hypothetical protein [Spirochaetaceae bacterium]
MTLLKFNKLSSFDGGLSISSFVTPPFSSRLRPDIPLEPVISSLIKRRLYPRPPREAARRLHS